MINIITSNIIPITSIKRYNNDFMFCHHYKRRVLLPFNETKVKHIFQIFHQTDMDCDVESYTNSTELEFNFIQKPTMLECLDDIASALCEQFDHQKDDDNPEEIMIVVACDISWNNQVVSYLNKALQSRGIDTTCLNLYQYLRIADYDKIKTMMKNILGSEFIYPEDPISFSYAIDRALIGLV